MDNKAPQYSAEKSRRWELGKEGEPKAIRVISEYLSKYLGNLDSVVEYRFDDMWFDKFDINLPRNEWVKGSSDYCLDFPNALIYAEIKIKTQTFRKTVSGGKTKAGSQISSYGCESYYLDINPVWKNMNLFCERLHINKDSFVIFFCNSNCTEIRFISLARINELIECGYLGKPLNRFSEGYGIVTSDGQRAENYLIPIDATINLFDLDVNTLDANAEHNILISCIKTNKKEKENVVYYIEKQNYYHRIKTCRFIKNKTNIIECSINDVPKEKQKCTECFD